jgi:hypothetical protein
MANIIRAGRIAPEVSRLVYDMISEISEITEDSISLRLSLLKENPILGTVLSVKTLLALKSLGEYTNPDKDIEAFIRENFRNMNGSFQWSFAEMYAAEALGYSFVERSVRSRGGQWVLESLRAVDPRHYKFIGQGGKKGRVTGIRYKLPGTYGVDIPIEKGCHIVNSRELCYGDPYGVPNLARAMSATRAWKILMGQMLTAGQRQATGIIVGYAPSNQAVPLLKSDGTPMTDDAGDIVTIPAPDALGNQLINLENGSIISTDTQNKIEMLSQQTDGAFFFQAIALCERLMMLGMLFPNTLLSTVDSTGGISSGDSNLNSGHMEIMRLLTESANRQIEEEIINKVVRPLVDWNFGMQLNYGKFQESEHDKESRLELLDILVRSINAQLISSEDQDAIDRARELAGLPSTSELMN